jgi:hypothetical protein
MTSHRLVTALIAIALALAAPTPSAQGYDEARDRALCLELTHLAVGANAKAGRWLDRVTRHDGVAVECADKRFELKRFTKLRPDRAGED